MEIRFVFWTVTILFGGACSQAKPLGTAGSCFATTEQGADELSPLAEVSERRAGVNRVPPEDEQGPPERFEDCAKGMPIVGEFIDDSGARFWLGLTATHAGRELLPREIFSLLRDSTVEVRQTRGWNDFDTVFITNGDQPILALQARATLRGDLGALRVEDAGGDALPSFTDCGSITSHSLRFTDDSETQTARNDQTIEMTVGGVEFLATNIFSLEYDWQNCSDGPFPENQATWVAHDNSL